MTRPQKITLAEMRASGVSRTSAAIWFAPKDHEDFGERSAINVVAGRTRAKMAIAKPLNLFPRT